MATKTLLPGESGSEFHDMLLREWEERALITLREAMEGYMVQVVAEYHC